MMKVEVFFFDGCPNHQAAVDRVKEVSQEEDLETEVMEIEISDQASAEAAGFLGSPSIRVDGLDVEPSARSSRAYGVMCRMYWEGGQRVGIPSRDLIRDAMQGAIGATTKRFGVAESVYEVLSKDRASGRRA